jgi:hypothetical protein
MYFVDFNFHFQFIFLIEYRSARPKLERHVAGSTSQSKIDVNAMHTSHRTLDTGSGKIAAGGKGEVKRETGNENWKTKRETRNEKREKGKGKQKRETEKEKR